MNFGISGTRQEKISWKFPDIPDDFCSKKIGKNWFLKNIQKFRRYFPKKRKWNSTGTGFLNGIQLESYFNNKVKSPIFILKKLNLYKIYKVLEETQIILIYLKN